MSEKKDKKYFANVVDLSQISPVIASLVMDDWFNKKNIICGKKRIDEVFVEINGKNTEQIEARVQILKETKNVRNGGGVRIISRKTRNEKL